MSAPAFVQQAMATKGGRAWKVGPEDFTLCCVIGQGEAHYWRRLCSLNLNRAKGRTRGFDCAHWVGW